MVILNTIFIASAFFYMFLGLRVCIKEGFKQGIWFLLTMSMLAFMSLGVVQTKPSTVSYEMPYEAIYKDGTLVVLDADKRVYIDSTYINGLVCIVKEKQNTMIDLFSNETRELNTHCQDFIK